MVLCLLTLTYSFTSFPPSLRSFRIIYHENPAVLYINKFRVAGLI